MTGQDFRVGVEVVLRDGENPAQFENQELQACTLAPGEGLFAPAVVAQDDDPHIALVGIAPGMSALVGNGSSLPDPSFAIDDVVVAYVGPSFVALVIALDTENLPAGCPFR